MIYREYASETARRQMYELEKALEPLLSKHLPLYFLKSVETRHDFNTQDFILKLRLSQDGKVSVSHSHEHELPLLQSPQPGEA